MKGFARLATGDVVEVHRVGDMVRFMPASAETAGPNLARPVAIGPVDRFSAERVKARWRSLSEMDAA